MISSFPLPPRSTAIRRNPGNGRFPTLPISPYGCSKLMTEIMLRDAGRAHGLRYVILRYFNVAGADPQCRSGQSTQGATHLIKVAVEAALGLRPARIFGTDYPTPDGTCIRDYIHVSDLVRAHSDALRHLRCGAPSLTLNCGYGHGFSVLEVIEAVKRASGVDFKVDIAPRRPAIRRASSPIPGRLARRLAGGRASTIFPRLSPTHWPGNANSLRAAHHEGMSSSLYRPSNDPRGTTDVQGYRYRQERAFRTAVELLITIPGISDSARRSLQPKSART